MNQTRNGNFIIRPGHTELDYKAIDFVGTEGHLIEGWSGMDGLVTFTDCSFTAVGGDCLRIGGYMRFKFNRCKFVNLFGKEGKQRGRPINIHKPRLIHIENCEWQDGSGVLIDHTDDSGQAEYVYVGKNIARNSSKATRDGHNGGEHCQGLQLSNVHTLNGYKSVKIEWLEATNEYGKAWVEDIVSITNCKGTKENPIIADNLFLRGAYPLPGVNHFSGSGLTIENNSEYVQVTNMQAVDCMNACFNIAGGSHNLITKSRGISASLKGDKSHLYWAGSSCFNSNNTPDELFATNRIEGNVYGYNTNRNLQHAYPKPGRHDICNILRKDTGRRENNWMDLDKNKYMTASITAEWEDFEYGIWRDRVRAAGITLGTTAPTAPPKVIVPAKKVLRTGYWIIDGKRRAYIAYDDKTWEYK